MRSRPSLEVFIDPPVPVPGAPLTVRVKLASSSETPIDGVEMRLTGVERRYSHTSRSGKSSRRIFRTHTHVALESMTAAETLGLGERRYATRFDLPAGLPPSYADDYSSIVYRLEVRVHIPWWPDRKESFQLLIRPPAWGASPRGAIVHATHPNGPIPSAIYMEATVDAESAYLGGALRGVLSLANVTKRLKSVSLLLVAVNRATFKSSAQSEPVRQYEGTLDPPPKEGVSTPFALAVPERELPSFQAAMFHHLWFFQMRANLSLASDTTLSIPLLIAPLPPSGSATARLARLPPVGHERRAKIWAHVAHRLGMTNDAASESMSATVGSIAVRIELEHRDEVGLCSVATLGWRDAGIDLQVTERRWTDRLRRRSHEVGHAAFDERFVVRAREEEQARSLMSPAVAGALLEMSEAVLHDDGAVLAAPGGGHRLDKLERFVAMVRACAAAMDQALPHIPPPAIARAAAVAWRAYAVHHKAHFETGSLSLIGLPWDGVVLDIRSQWEDGDFLRIDVEHRLDDHVQIDGGSAQIALDNARSKHGVQLTDRVVRASATALVDDPQRLEPLFAVVSGLVRTLDPRTARGPYR